MPALCGVAMPALPASVLICRVGDMRVAIDAGRVREILPLLPVWRPPGVPRPLAGFVAIRGETLPVLSLAALNDPEAVADEVEVTAHIVRPADAGPGTPCLLVDRVEDRVEPGEEAVGPVADTMSFNGTIIAEIALAGGVAHLISLDRLLTEGERARLAALTDEAQRRAAEWAEA